MDYLKFEHIKCAGCGLLIIRKDFLIASNHESWCEVIEYSIGAEK